MIDTKEKLKHCLAVEKNIYFPGGGGRLPFGIREKDVLYSYIYNLRKTEYHLNRGTNLGCFYIKYGYREWQIFMECISVLMFVMRG